ncbi:protein of unknown function [endosymbiont DhMRE of Dentiscutata heterogama]|uniref:hypothetical protein n=1 Tax=endosymbiont DhMRE of Dentiscutata heterogama TaxID=1609546 RepID=UPI000629DCBF|nr:hypothetical protein [endosymbiont DhMRE of Dentiscutata heterogama]CFW92900.1 protein of unknown function [endosymbiont DhMRE of Dentiscutata heterogama]
MPPQYQNWEEQLLKLTSEKEINDFRIALEREIEQQARLAIALSNESKNNKQNGGWIWLILVIITTLSIVNLVLAIRRKTRRKIISG